MSRNLEPWNGGRGGDVSVALRDRRLWTHPVTMPRRGLALYHGSGPDIIGCGGEFASEETKILSGDRIIPLDVIKQGQDTYVWKSPE